MAKEVRNDFRRHGRVVCRRCADRHAAAVTWLQTNTEQLLTTAYIVDETLTLLRMRKHRRKAQQMGEQLFNSVLAELYLLTEEDLLQAWDVFQDYDDKDWSFTDCTSKIIIEKLGLTHAFSFDHHFQQFGTVTVVP
jgi:hypothetical protein